MTTVRSQGAIGLLTVARLTCGGQSTPHSRVPRSCCPGGGVGAGLALPRGTMTFFARLATCALAASFFGCVGAGQNNAITDPDGGTPDAGRLPDGGPTNHGDAGTTTDAYLPWEGGPAYYASWTGGPSADPSTFPIAVWLQSPGNAQAYADLGVNTYVGLWNDTTQDDLDTLAAAGIRLIDDQASNTSFFASPTLEGWMQDDEPDNAQWNDSSQSYDPCIDPATLQGLYATWRSADSTRPVLINLGRGVAVTDWVGRGDCTGHTEMYPEYAKAADILTFDVYPVNSDDEAQDNLWYVATGVDNLRAAASDQKPVWAWIETTDINGTGIVPTPEQIRAEVWMALIHGARGIGYFCHMFGPNGEFIAEDGLLQTTASADAVTAIDAQILQLAPALNTPSISNAATVSSGNSAVPVDLMVKRQGGALYLFAAAMRPGNTHVHFTLSGVSTGTVTVLGESRTLQVTNGAFEDDFAADYAVHLYKVGQ